MALSFGPLYQDFYGDLKKRREEEAVAKAQGITLPAVQMSNQVKSRASQLPKQNAWDLIKDTLFDANTAQDKYRRSISGRPEEYGKNFGQGVTDNIVDAGKTFVSSIAETPGAIAGAAGPLLKAANDNPLERFFSRAGGKILYNKSDAQIEKRIKQQRELTDLSNQEAFKISKGMMDAPSNVEALKPVDPNSGGATAGRLAGNMISDTAVALAAPGVSPYYAALKYGGSQGTRTFSETGDANTANKAAAVTGTTQGLLAKVALANMVKPGMKVLPRVGLGVADSGGSQLITNAVDQATWDKNRQLTEGVGLASLIGGGVGLGTAALRRGSKKPPTETTETPTRPLQVEPTKLAKAEPQPTVRPVVTGPSAAPVKPQVEAPQVGKTGKPKVAIKTDKPVVEMSNEARYLELENQRRELLGQEPITIDPLEALKAEARKYKSADEFVEAKKFEKGSTVPIGDQVSFEKTLSPQDLAIHQRLKDIQHKMAALDPKNGYKPYKISQEDKAFYSKYGPEAGKKYQAYFAKADKAHQQLTDIYNQAHAEAPQVGKTDNIVYHGKGVGGSETGDRYGKGLYVTSDKKRASGYANGGAVDEYSLDGLKLANLDDKVDSKIVDILKREINDSIKNGDDYYKNAIRMSVGEKTFSKTDIASARNFVDEQRAIASKLGLGEDSMPITKKNSDGSFTITYVDDTLESLKNIDGNRLFRSLPTPTAQSLFTAAGFDGVSYRGLGGDIESVVYNGKLNKSTPPQVGKALKGETPKTGFSRAGDSIDMSRYKPTGQTPEQARIADMAKRTGISESTLIREASRRGGIDKIEGVASSLTDDITARSKDAVFTAKLKDTVPVVKQSQKPEVTAKLPVREDVPYDVDPVTGTYRTAADMIDNAPEAKKVSAVQAQEITGAIVNRVDEGMDAVDNILKAKGSSLEEMFRAIQTAMRNGDAFPEQYRAEYNMVKATLDKLRDASGKKMGDVGDGYLPQFRPDGGPQVQVGKSLVELIDVEDFGFSKKRENLIPLEELDYSKEGIKKYATQAMSYKYRDALDIEAIQKRAMETDGVKLTDKEALAVRDKEVEIAKEVKEAASKPGAILKADILDKTDELAAAKKKKRIEISDTVSFAKRELLDTDTLTRDIKLRTPEGKTKNMFEVFGFRRYRDAEGNAKQILYKSLEEGDYESIQQHIAATNLPENVQKNLLKRLGDDLRAVQSRVDELDLPESKIADATQELYEAALTKFERRIAREELTRAMETYKISNKGLRKIVNFHAQRMLTHDGYTRNMAEKATNFVTGLYYRGALGYNVSSALLNLFELQRVTSEVGMINGAKAIGKALTDWDITKRYGLHESTFENLLELKKEGVNVKKGTLSKVENYSGLMKMFEWTERIKDATLLHALEAKYADAGLSNQARVTRILADFNKLAIKGGQFGSVGLYKSKTGRTLFQFMQYPIKDLTITLNKASKAFNGDTEATKYLARLLVQRTILYMVMNAAIGTSAEVAFGIFNPVRQSRIDEEASNAEKVVSYIPGGPSVSMLKDVYIAMQQAAREAERNDEQFDPGDVINKQVARDLTLLVPGGNQLINKSLSFKADMDRGYNQSSYKNDKGEEVNRARFAAPDNPIDIAKGYVFGPYSTKDANEYFGKKLGSDLPFVGKALEGERYSPVSKRQQERIEAGGNARELIEEERINQRAKKEFKKTNPNLWAAYQEITKTTYNESTKKRESDVITPEKWSKVYGDSSLKLYDYMKQMAEARNKQYGDPIDPLYKLTDKAKIKTVLELRSTFTGDDKEPKEILKARSPWFAQFQKDEANYYNSLGKFEEDSDFGSSDRKKQYIELGKQNPGIPDISKQKYPIISKYFDMKEKNPDAAKEFYKSNADALSAAFEQQKKDRWEWTNQMRSLEGAPAIPWEAFQNVTFGYEDDEEKVAKALYFKGKSGSGSGGSRKVSMKNPYSYGSGLTPRKAKTQTVKKITAPKVKVASSKTTKPKVTMKKSKV